MTTLGRSARRVFRVLFRLYRIVTELPLALLAPSINTRLGATAVDLTGGQMGDVPLTNPSLLMRDSSSALIAAREVGYRLSRSGGSLFQSTSSGDTPMRSRTWTWTVSLPDGRPTSPPRPLTIPPRVPGDAGRGEEDPRLFRWRDADWGMWSIPMDGHTAGHSGHMAIARLRDGLADPSIPLPSPLARTAEKNWIPAVKGDELFMIHDLASKRVFSVTESGLAPTSTASQRDRRLAGQSGSSAAIPWHDGWLMISHRWAPTLPLAMPIPHRFYTHRFVWLGADFRTIAISRRFRFEVRGIEFCAGLAADDESVYISYGLHDARARMIRVARSDVESLLRPRSTLRRGRSSPASRSKASGEGVAIQ